MSLINQMLNDLDSRHAEAGEKRVPNEVRPLPSLRARSRGPLLAGLAALLFGGAAAAWFWLARPGPSAPVVPSPVAAVPAPVAGGAVTPPDAPGLPPLAVPAALPVAPPPAPPEPVAAVTAAPVAASVPALPRPLDPALRLTHSVSLPQAAAPPPPPTQAPSVAPPPVASATASEGNIAKQARPPTQRERSEANYRSAVAHLNQGRGDEAVATLRAVLHEDPAHQAARQLLLRLLLEAHAHDELRDILAAGLLQSPQQTSWALLLARLLADKGDNEAALKVLHGKALEPGAELRGATGALLQRLGRHAEAESHYAEALRFDGRDARWWVGLGLAAEAQGKPAREIFLRAREVGGLAPELQSFVEQKLR